ncbi:MAG: tRNA (guanosine(37)-N1)-methyltransferase TrmD [Candidatus Abawacabacteria bacterium]|nr:tRNA (guanosine(37)-N1)-methyltransferase TrmD [Candidatus Abawacabacteria bacterium]
MVFHIISLFPQMLASTLEASILGRARKKGLVSFQFYNLRDYGKGKYHQVDDVPYGGGAGMVMMPEPLAAAIQEVKSKIHNAIQHSEFSIQNSPRVLYLSAQGKRFTQSKAEKLSKLSDIVLICGHYEGIDQRIIDLYVDEEISIGDYVLTGGELPALVLIDAVSRLLPGVLGSDESSAEESFSKKLKRKKEYPHYTRPETFEGLPVPPVLLSGHHAKIAQWRKENCK